MPKAAIPEPRVEVLSIPDDEGLLGEIFEAAILHDMRRAASGELNRHFHANVVVLVLEIKGEARYGDETGRVVSLSPGDCFLLDPRIGHHYGPLPGSYWTEMYVCFRGPIFDSLGAHLQMISDPVRHLGSLPRWQRRLRKVLPGQGEADAHDACIGRLVAFLAEAFPAPSVAGTGVDPWILEAKRLLDREHLNVAEVTARLSSTTGLASETLRKRFRVVVGHSMKSWQMAAKIATARSLLARGNMTQKEIAATLGFAHPQHFSRCLQKATGSTPGKLAKSSR